MSSAVRATERGDGDAGDCIRNRGDTVEVAWRRRGEAGLDDVDAQPFEAQRDLALLARAQCDARRLLAVSQSCVEDLDPAHSVYSSVGPTGLWAHYFRLTSVCAASNGRVSAFSP